MKIICGLGPRWSGLGRHMIFIVISHDVAMTRKRRGAAVAALRQAHNPALRPQMYAAHTAPQHHQSNLEHVDELTRLLRDQGDVATWPQLLAAGVSRHVLRTHVARGRWTRLHPSIYAASGAPDLLVRCRGALLRAGRPAAVTGVAALAVHGVPLAEPPLLVEVLVPSDRHWTRDGGPVRARRTRHLDEADLLVRSGVTVVRVERALVDAARAMPPRALRTVTAAAVQGGFTTPALVAQCTDAVGRRNRTPGLVAVVAEVCAGERSAAEVALAELLRRGGIEGAVAQWPLDLPGHGRVFLDVYLPRHRLAIEVDGEQWHLSPEAWRADLRRQNALAAAGIRTVRFAANDLRDDAPQVLEQVRRAMAGERLAS